MMAVGISMAAWTVDGRRRCSGIKPVGNTAAGRDVPSSRRNARCGRRIFIL